MKEINKLALLLSNKLFGFMIFVIGCLIIVATLFWQYQTGADQLQQQQTQQYKQHQQAADMLNKVTSAQIILLQKQLVLFAQRTTLSTALKSKNVNQIASQQQVLRDAFPKAKSACLIGIEVDNIDDGTCIPITYAVLESLRQAKKEGSSPIALLQAGTDAAYLLVAQRIIDQDNNISGVLILTFSPDLVSELLFKDLNVAGYAELLQGTKNNITLASQGNMALKQGNAPFLVDIADTHWHIAYWPENLPITTPSLVPIIVIFGVMLLMWLLLEAVRLYLYKLDLATLKQQLTDLNSGALRTKYRILVDRGLQDISAQIQALAKTIAISPSNREPTTSETTSERISKKLEENKTDNPAELDMLEESVDIDQSIFKAYDIRGIVDQTLNSQVMNIIGRAIGSEAQKLGIKRVIVGYDGRHSGPEYSEALIVGILSSGCDVSDLGMVPTPVVYFASHHLNTQSAVMVTGSHNPANYNGLKINLAGKSLAGDALQALYRRIEQHDFLNGQGSRHEVDVTENYIQRITSDIHLSRPIKIVIDCGNGVAGNIAPQLFRALGCDVTELYCEVDGDFPNHSPDPSQPDNLQDLVKTVQQQGAELGIAFDGDGDRLGVVDALGNTIFPDRMMMMFAQDVLLRLPGSVIIYDVKSTNLLGQEISRAGGEAVMWQSGHSLIKNKMMEMNAQLAGELSGHIFFKERWYGFDDGMYATSRLLELISQDPLARPATEIFAALPNRKSTPEILLAMDAIESKQFIAQFQREASFPDAQITTIDGLRADYSNGWGLVRASNTVPGLTLRFEGDTEADLVFIQEQFKQQMLHVEPKLTIVFPKRALPIVSNEKPTLSVNEPISLATNEAETLFYDQPTLPVQQPSSAVTPEKKSHLELKDIE